MDSTNGKYVVVGLGRTGLACARYLSAQGCDVLVMDSQAAPTLLPELRMSLPQVETVLGGLDEARLKAAAKIILSPGVPLADPAVAAAVQSGVEVVGDIELFARVVKAPVIAITGSNGKSTVTSLVYEMARAAGRDVRVGGNIGTPVLELLAGHEPELYVLELSSFQLETTHSLKSAAAVVLNISQDHLDRYDSMDCYAQTKRKILEGAWVKVFNLDDPLVGAWQQECAKGDCKWSAFTLAEPSGTEVFGISRQKDEDWLARGSIMLMPVRKVKIVGKHNIANALAALALGEVIGLPMAAMLDALRAFPGLPHRCQWLAEHNGVAWFNDSKATNVGAAVAAIEGFDGKVVLIAGGEGKGQDFSPLRDALAAKGRALVLLGRDADLIEQAVEGAVPTVKAADMGDAVAQAAVLAQSGDVVLLAPACASFDMFSGYVERGEMFAQAVKECLS